MFRKSFICLMIVAVGLIAGCGKGEDKTSEKKALNDTGTSLGGATVVRTALLRVTGAINENMQAPRDETTTLTGNCKPDMWANFGIKFNHPDYVWIAVSIMTKDPIQTGQTGPVSLDWVDVSFFTEEMKSLFFRGPGTFKITLHDSSPNNRRMKGTIKADDLNGMFDAAGKKIDIDFEFDMNFSCGVEER
ncbi:MAG: hypothetical protein Q8Q33_01650 [Chlamydiota bacterium]|nr:hypothetical protein [Chlamydiota bacterium]